MKPFQIEDYRLPLGERIAYTIDEAARLIGFSRSWLYAYVASGELRSVKIGAKKRLILRSDLLAFLENVAGAAPAAPTSDSAVESQGDEE